MTRSVKTKIGLMGGTFDPIHLGHMRAAEEIKEILNLDRICFVPSRVPPHKNSDNISKTSDRLNMLKLALGDIPYFDIDEFELTRNTTSYTIDTLTHLTYHHPDSEFYFIVGNELFKDIDTWKKYEELFKTANFIVLARPGVEQNNSDLLPLALKSQFRYYKGSGESKSYVNKDGKLVIFTQINGLKISSTEIRNLVKENKSITNLVPPGVEKYIIGNKLYITEADQ